MTPPTAVLFDNDGLLLDSESVWTRAERDLFERHGLEFTIDHKLELVGTNPKIAGGILEQRLEQPGRGPAPREPRSRSSRTPRADSWNERWRWSGWRASSVHS